MVTRDKDWEQKDKSKQAHEMRVRMYSKNNKSTNPSKQC